MPDADHTNLHCSELTISVPGRTLVEDLAFECGGGEFLAVLGPNGVGKSLALLTLAGLRPAETGAIRLNGRPLGAWPRADIAVRLALLPQYTEDFFPTTVFDTAMIGRHPHIGRWRWETAEDRRIASEVLGLVDLADMAERDVLTLSGGERRRLAVAQVLAQAPRVYLLDEPTNHLDPQHQLDVLQIFRRKADDGDAVIASLHDVNLAARFADRCLLFHGDGRWAIGPTADILTGERLSELYLTDMEAVDWRGGRLFVASG